MAGMTMQEAGAFSIALLTAVTHNDWVAAESLFEDVGREDSQLVAIALCGSVSGVIQYLALATGRDETELTEELLKGVGASIATDPTD